MGMTYLRHRRIGTTAPIPVARHGATSGGRVWR